MIVIRNVFRLKFGKAREAVPLLKEGVAIQKRAGANFSARILTDLTGPFYTVVLELTAPDLSSFEKGGPPVYGRQGLSSQLPKACATHRVRAPRDFHHRGVERDLGRRCPVWVCHDFSCQRPCYL